MFKSSDYHAANIVVDSIQQWVDEAEVLTARSTTAGALNNDWHPAPMSERDWNEFLGSLPCDHARLPEAPDSDTDASASPSSSPTASLLSSNISGHELGSYFAPCPLNDRWRNTGKAIRLSRRRPGEIHLSPLPSAYRIGLLKRCRDGYNFGSLLKLDDGLSSDEDFVYFNFDPSKYREVIIRKNGRRSICRPDSATTFTDWIKGFVFGTDCCKHRNSVWFYQANCVHDIMEEENGKRYTKDTFNRPDTMIKHLSKCKEVQREFPEVFWFCKAWIEAKHRLTKMGEQLRIDIEFLVHSRESRLLTLPCNMHLNNC
ncbi:hypothetical protein BT69DRAFT_1300906 [Atractiella rhizophila]|nr:hypothetical protein BT69DRAFT_1300906 [Atractiella rhizophila]